MQCLPHLSLRDGSTREFQLHFPSCVILVPRQSGLFPALGWCGTSRISLLVIRECVYTHWGQYWISHSCVLGPDTGPHTQRGSHRVIEVRLGSLVEAPASPSLERLHAPTLGAPPGAPRGAELVLYFPECLCSGHRSPPSHPPSLLTTRRDHSRIWKLSRVDAKKRDCLFPVPSQVDLAIGLSQASLPGEGRGGEWRGTHSLPGVLPQEAERLAPDRGVVFHAKCRCCVWATDADERWQNRPVLCLLLLTPGRAVGGPWSLFWP